MSRRHKNAYTGRQWRAAWACLVVLVVFASNAGAARAYEVDRLRGEYRSGISDLARERVLLAAEYAGARDGAARRLVLARARALVLRTMTERLLPAWIGTPWAFNGTSRTPGEGAIACGSFVVFTLRHAGFRIPSRMLRQPSLNIIKNLVASEPIRIFSNAAPVARVLREVRRQGDGLYMVGLDIHVGFLVNRGGRITFFHSSYVGTARVIEEDAAAPNPFSASRYRVVAKLFGDAMMVRWLRAHRFAVVHDYFKRR